MKNITKTHKINTIKKLIKTWISFIAFFDFFQMRVKY